MTLVPVPPAAMSEASRLHRLGVDATAAGQPAVAARQLRKALRLLGIRLAPRSAAPPRPVGSETNPDGAPDESALPPDQRALAAKLFTSLAHAEAERGRTSLGFALLVRCETLVAPADRGTLHGQRGLLLLRTGKVQAALDEFDRAVGLIDADGEPVELARVLLNRSVARIETGRFAGARSDLEQCITLSRSADRPLLAVKAMHNLGYCDLVTGDIPAALRAIGKAADGFATLSPSWQPVAILDIARALLDVGLATDAAAELDTAMELFRGQQMSQDEAEAEAVRAEASLLAGDARAARGWARKAGAGFRRRGNASGAAVAELIELRAEYQLAVARQPDPGTDAEPGRPITTTSPRRLAARAFDLARRLRAAGARPDAAAAELLGIRALISAGRSTEASRRASAFRLPGGSTPLDVRLLRYLTLAELAAASGQRDRALRTLRSGLAVLAQHRSGLGSVDLQTGTAALGVELAASGLALSVTVRHHREAFAWSELSRAQALRIKPVRPPTDPDVAAAVAELRQLEFSRRTAAMSGTSAAAGLDGRRAALERRIRHSAWPALGEGTAGQVASLDEVAGALAPRNQALISLFRQNETLFALVVSDRDSRILPLGDATVICETARRLRADLTALVGRRLPTRMEKAIFQAVSAHAEQLNAQLFQPAVAGLIGDREIVVVPCGPLTALPWQLLPAVRGRPLAVSPSATSWLAAHRSMTGAAPGACTGPALIGGPGLTESGRELAAIASLYPHSTTLRGGEATVQATLRALDGAPMAHLAVHGRHEPDNVLFSRLELADGPLMAYDLLHLSAAPRHIVLSACDVGRVSMRPGDEPLGLVSTLLHLGSPTVIAAAAPVLDAATAEMMDVYYRHLRSGRTPAQALAATTGQNPTAAFCCFGAG
jgi:tetratricopeptide (TPR) repeat protein